MADIKWIKITTDVFDDEKMKIIDTLPDRDAIIVIWFKLLALTGKKNESGLLFLSPKMAYTDEMLATVFNRPLNTVRLALTTFENFGMIEIAENQVISVINWEKHQNVDGMEKVKEQNRLRQQKRRMKQKEEKDKLEAPKVELLECDNVTSRDSHETDKNRLDKIRKEKPTQGVSNYDNFYKKIAEVTCINYITIQQTVLPMKLKELDIDKVISEIDNSEFLLKQNGTTGFRKYFSTIHQLKKIETGYYKNDIKDKKLQEKINKTKKEVETLKVKGWEL